MDATHPRISVILPAYNAEKFLVEAIESILAQTEPSFELIIIDDASTDSTPEILAAYAKQDDRIRMMRNTKNSGVATTLNNGLDQARGTYVARMDADDISLPNRLKRQADWLDAHPTVAILGAWAEMFNADGNLSILKTPVGNRLRSEFWKPSPMIHPTVMMRRSALGNLRYEPSKRAEDYPIWLYFGKHGQLANLPEPLLRYRIHGSNVSLNFPSGTAEEIYLSFCHELNIPEEVLTQDAFENLFRKNYYVTPWQHYQNARKISRYIPAFTPGAQLLTSSIYLVFWLIQIARKPKKR